MSISIDDDLRARMDSLERQPNWSAIAVVAFRQHVAAVEPRNKEVPMSTTLDRMKASQKQEAMQYADIGRREGREWAMQYATPRQLKKLEVARDPVHDWGIGSGQSAFSEGDRVAAKLNGSEEVERGAFDQMVSDEFEDLHDDAEFVQGFAEGCVEVWEEVKDEL